jgi:hypothetical protein
MRMNQSHVNQYPIVDEEPNANTARFFFIFWKIMTNHYGIAAQITVNYQSLHRCLPSSQIIGWVRSVMIELSNGQEAFYLKRTCWKRTSIVLTAW